MGVRIDEAGRDDQSAGVDGARGDDASGGGIADEGDAITGDADIRSASGGAGAIDNGSAAHQDVDPLLSEDSRRQGKRESEGALHMTLSRASLSRLTLAFKSAARWTRNARLLRSPRTAKSLQTCAAFTMTKVYF